MSAGRIGWRLVQFAGAFVLFKDYVAEAALCSGESMAPTIKAEGEMVLVEKLSTMFRNVGRGDVVVAVSPLDPDKLICKRIVAVAGDLVSVGSSMFSTSYQKVPQGHVWLEGDNQQKSFDSTSFGPVPFGLLRGKVFCKVWPLSEFGAKVQ